MIKLTPTFSRVLASISAATVDKIVTDASIVGKGMIELRFFLIRDVMTTCNTFIDLPLMRVLNPQYSLLTSLEK